MNKGEAQKHLQLLGEELQRRQRTGEILVNDGVIVMLDIGKPEEKIDIDAYMAYLKGEGPAVERQTSVDAYFKRKLWKKFPGLHVYTASLDYLFVTKIMAGRPKDDGDVVALAKMLCISTQEEALVLMAQYVPRKEITVDVLRRIRRCFKR